MEIKAANSELEVNTLSEWLEHCGPVNPDIQWKDKRSAKEMARFWLDKNNRESFIKFLSHECPNILFENAFPEYPTKFDKYSKPRINDLCIYAKSNQKPIFISIEGKADEPYGSSYFLEELKLGVERKCKDFASKKLNRMMALYERFGHNEEVLKLRYQLVFWFAGSIEEAIRKNIKEVVLVSQEFHGDITNEIKIETNRNDFNSFIGFISQSQHDSIVHQQIIGPINNEYTKGINVYFGKFVVRLK